ncbi:GreA/GreB family elongation factor [Seonamhaeicola aphaedonensis]|uniref:GreA/GreB family transcription elongation factor n=1 Tax=Seonamhaeicola aphaedonensis TaxID=1461338 RepID=A0A3D9HML0_9FLAO|nr:GreA/GreB family elongation factor [Seonamhaeicola aphaedonensis]RED50699.1 GreA/GreB family transcription elongation factor [Seonamhaeicola aphaedonensis]
MNIKEELYKQCEAFIEIRLKAIQKSIDEIQNSLTTETKSSAGDKHETGRAMLQLEREKAGKQLSETEKIKHILNRINIESSQKSIGLGSVVYTSKSNYFITISAGELKVEEKPFFAISVHTPIGQLLLGKTVGDSIKFRNQEFIIEKIE